ncbi:phospholipase-like protein [Tanacetum coccineum]
MVKNKNGKTYVCGQDKENEEDVPIAILKSLVGECKAVYTNKVAKIEASLHGTNEVQGVSFVADDEEGNISGALPLGASVNVIPKSIFEHLKLANLKETDMVVEMVDMTKKAPLGMVENIMETDMVVEMVDMTKKAPIGMVENIMVKINKFLFPSDFIIIDMLREPSEIMILCRPFLATMHAQIDVFKREISLGIGEDRVKFDMNRGVCHSRILIEKFYMANSVHEE